MRPGCAIASMVPGTWKVRDNYLLRNIPEEVGASAVRETTGWLLPRIRSAGLGLDLAEAKVVLARIHDRFPCYRPTGEISRKRC